MIVDFFLPSRSIDLLNATNHLVAWQRCVLRVAVPLDRGIVLRKNDRFYFLRRQHVVNLPPVIDLVAADLRSRRRGTAWSSSWSLFSVGTTASISRVAGLIAICDLCHIRRLLTSCLQIFNFPSPNTFSRCRQQTIRLDRCIGRHSDRATTPRPVWSANCNRTPQSRPPHQIDKPTSQALRLAVRRPKHVRSGSKQSTAASL